MKQFAVVAAFSADISDETNLEDFVCSSCKTQTSSNLNEPHCPSCGSTQLSKLEESSNSDTTMIIEAEDELSAIHCSACEAYNILPTHQISDLEENIHCSVCGVLSELEIDEAEPDTNMDEETDEDDGFSGASQEDRDRDEGEMSATGEHMLPPIKETDVDKLDATRQDSYGEGPEAKNPPRKESYYNTNNPVVKGNETGNEAGVTTVRPESYDGKGVVMEDRDNKDKNSMKMYLNLSSMLSDKAISMLTTDEVIHLVADGRVVVASLKETEAGVNKDIFTESRFLDAIEKVISSEGLEVAISSFNFTPIMLEVPVPAVVKGMVDKQVSETSAIIISKVAEDDEDMLQSMSIAASGINKGFFSDAQNSLYTGLLNELSTLLPEDAVHNVVDSVFNTQADDYNKTLITKAREISGMALEVRNQLSAAIGNARVTSRVVDIGERLEDAAVPTKLPKVTSNLVESKVVTLNREASKRGGLFNRN